MKTIILTPTKVLLKISGDTFGIPLAKELFFFDIESGAVEFDGYSDANYSFICINEEIETPENYAFKSFREIWETVDDNTLSVVGRANQLGFWHRNSTYCGRCASELTFKENELGKICTSCGNMSYPAAFPAVIIAVFKGEETLLVKTKYQQYPFYSSVAGFVDPGEKLEDTAAREVMEEVGLTIDNIKYYDSQPFAPSNNIMIGFTAEYKSGEISPQESEISEAAWFHLNNLPYLPPGKSLASRMIEDRKIALGFGKL